jgi:hypothetical protein
MDLAQVEGGTTPFLTFDACNGERAQMVVSALESYNQGREEKWQHLVATDQFLQQRLKEQGIENPEKRSQIKWDDPTLLFITCIELNFEGRQISVGELQIRERIG